MILFALAAAAVAASSPASPPEDDPIATLAQLQQLYGQTCVVKAYGTYDDICHALRDQIHDAEKVADKEAKQKAKAGDKPATPTAEALR